MCYYVRMSNMHYCSSRRKGAAMCQIMIHEKTSLAFVGSLPDFVHCYTLLLYNKINSLLIFKVIWQGQRQIWISCLFHINKVIALLTRNVDIKMFQWYYKYHISNELHKRSVWTARGCIHYDIVMPVLIFKLYLSFSIMV